MPSKSANKSSNASAPKAKKAKTSGSGSQKAKKTSSASSKGKSKSVQQQVASKSKVVEAPVHAEPPVHAKPPVHAESQVESVVSELSTGQLIEKDFVSLAEKLNTIRSLQASFASDLKKLQKNIMRHIKENKKKKKRVVDPNKPKRSPSGFAKPAPISTELCDFLEKPYGTEMARTEVTREITKYIKERNLQDEKNRRIILPDEKLQVLMKFPKGDEPITYFNLQKYLAVHFIKKEESAPTKTI